MIKFMIDMFIFRKISNPKWTKMFRFVWTHRDETLEALSDARIVAPAVQTADLHSADHRNSFLYVFDYQTKFGDFPQVSNTNKCNLKNSL